jgi:protease-4
MKQFLLTVAGVFVGLAIFLIGVPFLLVAMAAGAAKPAAVPARTVLELDLRGGLTDQGDSGALAAFSGGGDSVLTVVDTLKKAQGDDRIRGVLVRLPEGGLSPAAADELRLAFRRFRASGKPMVAHSQGLYASGAVASTYMLGASSGELWMQPLSSFQVTGMASEDIFFRRAFDKYGVKPEYEKRAEYKTAVNPYLESDYTPAHRESELSWMTSIYSTALTTAAGDRKTDAAALTKTLETGPYGAEQARALGLIDRVGQAQEARASLLARAGSGAKLVEFDDYEAKTRRERSQVGRGAPVIALIGAEGAIMTGEGGSGSPFISERVVYSDEISDALREATEDRDVKAIVLRVSSPGGSDTASEQILSAVRAAKAAGKPVVVSMGVYAASGGYWISSQASSIVAEPTTLTGSIGVYGGKIALGEALGRFGVDVRQCRSAATTPAPSACPRASIPPSARPSPPGWTRSTRASSPASPRAASCRPSGCARSPAAVCGPASRPNNSALSTSLAASRRRSPAPRPGQDRRRGSRQEDGRMRSRRSRRSSGFSGSAKPRPAPWRPRPGCSAIPAPAASSTSSARPACAPRPAGRRCWPIRRCGRLRLRRQDQGPSGRPGGLFLSGWVRFPPPALRASSPIGGGFTPRWLLPLWGSSRRGGPGGLSRRDLSSSRGSR